MTYQPLLGANPPQLAFSTIPRCRNCKKTLSTTKDRQKTRDKWWTNCSSCRTTKTEEWRQKRGASLFRPNHAVTAEKRKRKHTDSEEASRSRATLSCSTYPGLAVAGEPEEGCSCPERRKDAIAWWARNREYAMCFACEGDMTIAWMTPCGHVICEWCYGDVLNEGASERWPCATCKVCDAEYQDCIPLNNEAQISSPRIKVKQKQDDRRVAVPPSAECSVCMEVFFEQDLPKLSECTHKPDVCQDCFSRWLESQLESTSWTEIQCPTNGCAQSITHSDVRRLASDEVFTRFDDLSMRAFLSNDPRFRYCLAEGCVSGQIHDTGTEGNIFRCNACGFRVCTVHSVAFHTDETCRQYDERRREEEEQLREQDREREAQNNLSLVEIEASTTKCPGCEVPIHKYVACDHITCTRCRFEFCYICRAPYRGENGIFAAGNSVHAEDCKYHPHSLPDYEGSDAESEAPVLVAQPNPRAPAGDFRAFDYPFDISDSESEDAGF